MSQDDLCGDCEDPRFTHDRETLIGGRERDWCYRCAGRRHSGDPDAKPEHPFKEID